MSNDPLNPIFPSPENDSLSEGVKIENYRKDQAKTFNLPLSGYSPNGTPIKEILRRLILQGGGHSHLWKENINFDQEIQEAIDELVLECLIPDGDDKPITSQDQIDATIHDCGCQVDIDLVLIL